MFCVNCGFQFEGNFCPNCGTPVGGAPVPSSNQGTPQPSPGPKVYPSVPHIVDTFMITAVNVLVKLEHESLIVEKINAADLDKDGKAESYKYKYVLPFQDIAFMGYHDMGVNAPTVIALRTPQTMRIPINLDCMLAADPLILYYPKKGKERARTLAEILDNIVQINGYDTSIVRYESGTLPSIEARKILSIPFFQMEDKKKKK